MSSEKMISVVVPVYNVEKYLHRCIESILNQTLDNFEVILVDDGSKDSSGQICDEYAETYEFIHVIHKENGGLSDARNRGISECTGKYITFIDSDDSIINSYLETLYNLITEYDADMSAGGFFFIDEEKVLNEMNKEEHDYVTSGKEAFKKMLYGKDIYSSACALLVKNDIVKKYLFPVGMYNEDDLTTYKYFLESHRVAVTTKQIYYYYQNQGSVMHTLNRQVLDLMFATNNYIEVAKKLGEEFVVGAYCRKYNIYKQIIRDYPDMEKAYHYEYLEVKRELGNLKKTIIFDFRYPIKLKLTVMKDCIRNIVRGRKCEK